MEPWKCFRLIATLMIASLVVACSTPYSTPAFKARPDGQTAFSGIAQLVAVAPNRVLDVVMVHGMCTRGQDWAERSIKGLNTSLGGTSNLKIKPLEVVGTKTTLYQAELSVLGGTVRVNALVWSPILVPLKKQICYDQTDKSMTCKAAEPSSPAYPYFRASLNRELKDDLLNDCLADVLIYQGKSRDVVSEQIQKAIVTAVASPVGSSISSDIFKAAAASSAPLVFITESLGSKVAFDAIHKLVTNLDENRRTAGIQTFDRTVQIFMAANQLPILALADQLLTGPVATRAFATDNAYQADPLAALIELKAKASLAKAAQAPVVVAFSDPNDLLSYLLVPAKQVATYDVVDVVVSNDNTYLGFLERPDIAHTGYLSNPKVMRLIARGYIPH